MAADERLRGGCATDSPVRPLLPGASPDDSPRPEPPCLLMWRSRRCRWDPRRCGLRPTIAICEDQPRVHPPTPAGQARLILANPMGSQYAGCGLSRATIRSPASDFGWPVCVFQPSWTICSRTAIVPWPRSRSLHHSPHASPRRATGAAAHGGRQPTARDTRKRGGARESYPAPGPLGMPPNCARRWRLRGRVSHQAVVFFL